MGSSSVSTVFYITQTFQLAEAVTFFVGRGPSVSFPSLFFQTRTRVDMFSHFYVLYGVLSMGRFARITRNIVQLAIATTAVITFCLSAPLSMQSAVYFPAMRADASFLSQLFRVKVRVYVE
jgi:hypothetical protein